MAITYNLWDTSTLLGSMNEEKPTQNYFLDLLFPRTLQSENEYIDMEKVTTTRKLAPFVLPMAQGRPTGGRGQQMQRFTPAYIKMLDSVNPARMLKRLPGSLLGPSNMTPMQRLEAITVDILADHRARWERRQEWMAAQAALYGEYIVVGEDYPEQLVQFGRAAGHTITLGGGSRWGETDVNPIDDLEEWATTMALADFSGAPDTLTCGPLAYAALRSTDAVQRLLDTQIRGTNSTLAPGYTGAQNGVKYKGELGPGLSVYVNSETYVADNGTVTPFMDPRDILLSSSAVQGVRAYGAILDEDAGLNALPIFPKSYKSPNPSMRFILSQSSPLMIPTNPNATLRARVVA